MYVSESIERKSTGEEVKPRFSECLLHLRSHFARTECINSASFQMAKRTRLCNLYNLK